MIENKNWIDLALVSLAIIVRGSSASEVDGESADLAALCNTITGRNLRGVDIEIVEVRRRKSEKNPEYIETEN